jgi:hypothetical protein
MLYRFIIGSAPLLGCLIWFGISPAYAQIDQERIQLILKLPPQKSAVYKAIKRLAGKVTSQSLPLTKCEMWSVPKKNVEAVKQAALRYGVIVKQLSKDWNQIFQKAPANITISDQQKHMMEIAKAAKSTIGVGMMAAPFGPMVEYALTKSVATDGRTDPHGFAKIRVALSEKTILTITRTSVDIKPDMCIWHGRVEGTDLPASIMWWPSGKMTGSVQHEGRIYSIRHMGGEMYAVVEMGEDRMPQEHAPMPERMRTNNPNLRDDPLLNQGDATLMRPVGQGKGIPTKGSLPEPEKTSSQAKAAKTKNDKSTPKPEDVVIDVIVAYTKKAAAYYSDVKRELVDLSIEEANESFRQSGIGQVKLRLVHAYQTDYVEEGEHFDHVWRFADKNDGYMDEIHPLRDKYRADVAVLIVDDPKGCGLATRVYADAEEAFAVVHHECAVASYSVAHEIGHLIGARHDPNVDQNMTPFSYGHGYVNGTKWRDIMSYKESCGGCPRLPVWSSPKVMVRGEVAGTPELDNARVIAEQAARVAAFR